MAVVVGSNFERQPQVAIRVGKTIRGDGSTVGAVHHQAENCQWLYANVGRSPLVELWGLEEYSGGTGPTHRNNQCGSAFETTSTSLVEIYTAWVNTRADWVDWEIDARIENAQLRVQIYDDVARSSLLSDSTLTATTVSDESATDTFTPTDHVLVVVKLKRNVGTPGRLHWLRVGPAIMAAADLP